VARGRSWLLGTVILVAACQDRPPSEAANAAPSPPEPVAANAPPPASPDPSLVSGALSYPSDHIPDDMEVCAEEVDSSRIQCGAFISDRDNGRVYELTLPPGRYRIYAQTAEMPDYRAYYSEAVVCGLSVHCTSHQPIIVELAAGQRRASIDPGDWFAPR
jgi:hypothetical protein